MLMMNATQKHFACLSRCIVVSTSEKYSEADGLTSRRKRSYLTLLLCLLLIYSTKQRVSLFSRHILVNLLCSDQRTVLFQIQPTSPLTTSEQGHALGIASLEIPEDTGPASLPQLYYLSVKRGLLIVLHNGCNISG